MKKDKIVGAGQIFVFLALFCLCIVFSGHLYGQEGGKYELSVGGVSIISDGFSDEFNFRLGAFSLGTFVSRTSKLELGGLIIGSGAIIAGNFAIGDFGPSFVNPYTTVGGWTTTYGGFGWNAGGGLKIKLIDKLAVRVEYRRWMMFPSLEGVNSIISGLAVTF